MLYSIQGRNNLFYLLLEHCHGAFLVRVRKLLVASGPVVIRQLTLTTKIDQSLLSLYMAEKKGQ